MSPRPPPGPIEQRLAALLAEHPSTVSPEEEAEDMLLPVLALILAHVIDMPEPRPQLHTA